MKYDIEAKHCAGRSVSHSCVDGMYSDPVESWRFTVEADTVKEAERLAIFDLFDFADEYPVCKCQRRLQPGGRAWFASVALSIRKANR